MSKFCGIPWSHLQIDPDGTARPCCIMQGTPNTQVGNINDTPIEELWNSPNMTSLRKNLLSGQGDPRCAVCDQYAEVGIPSFRDNFQKHMSRRFTELPRIVQSTQEDGFVPELNLEYWDFRFSNFCNFKCRTCGPDYSSAWYSDAKAIGALRSDSPAPKPITWLKAVDDRLDVLEKQIHQVKEIYFAGGEPLIMEDHIKTLDLLLKYGKTDVKLRYNTNLSTLKYKNFDILDDYWSKFNYVEISGSIDAIGDHAEYIRAGTKWSVVDKNIRRLVEAKKAGKIGLMFNVTISTLNVFYLFDLLNYFVEVGAVNDLSTYQNRPWQFWFNLVFTPEYYCIKNLPDSAKQSLREAFQKFDLENQIKNNVSYSFFTDLYPILDQPADPAQIERFKFKTEQLDKVRGESIQATLPELWAHYR